jgi:hypothetical protein
LFTAGLLHRSGRSALSIPDHLELSYRYSFRIFAPGRPRWYRAWNGRGDDRGEARAALLAGLRFGLGSGRLARGERRRLGFADHVAAAVRGGPGVDGWSADPIQVAIFTIATLSPVGLFSA